VSDGAARGARRRQPYTTDALVDVAVRVFLEHGYHATSISDIAAAAELGKSSLYHHVSGKEELLSRGLHRAFDALFAMLDEAGATTGTAAERLRYVLRRTVEITAAMVPEVSLLLRVRGTSPTEQWAMERRREFTRLVTGLVAAAQDEAGVRADLDPALVSRLVFGMTNSITDWYRDDRSETVADLVAAIDRIVFDGLARA
jgi:AcrR family transcriptional regulator